jgi:hypothetical protein
MSLKVGAARSVIEIPNDFFPREGFDGIHDSLYSKALIIDNGICRTALVVVDVTSMSEYDVNLRKELVSRDCGADISNIFICASHTFSAPHNLPAFMLVTDEDKEKDDALRKAINDSIHSSVTSAANSIQPAKIGFAYGKCSVNVNRDILTAQGWWKGSNEQGISDKDVAVIKFESIDGKTLAIFMNYAVQSSIMNESVMENGGKLVTSDLCGAAASFVESQYANETVALFSIGAAGDQEPYLTSNRHIIDKNKQFSRKDIHHEGFVLVELLGERLGSEVVRVSELIECKEAQIPLCVVSDTIRCKGQLIPGNIHDIHPSKKYDYQIKDEHDVPIWIMLIGDIALVGLQVELSSKTGLSIKQKSPFPKTIIMTMVNGSAKYMADAESYDRITYEAMNSMFAQGSAEKVEDKIISMLNNLQAGSIEN